MTKAEEMKVVEQIEEILRNADPDGYVVMTFNGICDVCRNNIVNDFGDVPVLDCADMRVAYDEEHRDHIKTKQLYEESQKTLKIALEEAENMRKQIDDLKEQRDCMAECIDGNNDIMERMDDEIRKLKAEIFRMRTERMTEVEMALMYDRMEGDFDD